MIDLSAAENQILCVTNSNNHFFGRLKLDFPTTIYFRCNSTSHDLYIAPGDTITMKIVKLKTPDTANSLLKNDVYKEALVFKNSLIEYIFFNSLREKPIAGAGIAAALYLLLSH